MLKTIRRAAIALTVGVLATTAAYATPTTLSLTTGYKGGSYHNVLGLNFSIVAREYGYKTTLTTSKGSVENASRVASGTYLAGFTQADAFASWLRKNPQEGANVEIIGSFGQECVYIAVAKDGPISDEDDIGKGTRIAVQKKGSGTAESWNFMATLEDDYSEASPVYKGGNRTLSKLGIGQLDAVMWVTAPGNLSHKYLATVMSKDSNLKLIDVDDYSLNDELPNGNKVYEFKTVETSTGFFSSSVSTICTDVLLIANANADEELLEDLATMALRDANRIMSAE